MTILRDRLDPVLTPSQPSPSPTAGVLGDVSATSAHVDELRRHSERISTFTSAIASLIDRLDV